VLAVFANGFAAFAGDSALLFGVHRGESSLVVIVAAISPATAVTATTATALIAAATAASATTTSIGLE
jgi:hypothetical protein